MTSYIIETSCTDPYLNLALEELLLESVQEQSIIFYLWQNANTVVIGRNQNAWAECNTSLFESEGGRLARRTSGGGAVYHDIGNLNFTILCSKELYDLPRQLSVIVGALSRLGIKADFSGRNDILLDGRKFSGNAFRHTQTASLHHGTLMMHTDFEKMQRYLTVSKDKLKSKGIASVRSRVCNLSEFKPDIDTDMLKRALKASFACEYGQPSELSPLDDGWQEQQIRKAALFSSWQWLYGSSPKFDIELKNRFSWGGVTLALCVKDGLITEAACYSDAMNEELIGRIPALLTGLKIIPSVLSDALLALPEYGHDLSEWVRLCNL